MVMKILFFGLSMIILLSCSCLAAQHSNREPVYPNKNLKEIIIRGNYWPENKEAAKEHEKELRERGLWKEDQEYEKERFNYSEHRYCYNETKNKKAFFRKDFRARLYDKQGKLLSEDFLRFNGSFNPKSNNFSIAHIPYKDNGLKIVIIRLEGTKEVILYTMKLSTQSELRQISDIDNEFYRRMRGWIFNEKSECHIAPPVR